MANKPFDKCVNWNGKDLSGLWLVTYKIDGVRVFLDCKTREAYSRRHVPIPKFPEELKDKLITKYSEYATRPLDFEVYRNNWATSISLTRDTKSPGFVADIDDCYMLPDDYVDKRLVGPWLSDPTEKEILNHLRVAAKAGYEGLVLRQDHKWVRVKHRFSYDVTIQNVVEGSGKYKGVIGSYSTEYGEVGSGMTDEQRRRGWFERKTLIGKTIEVECYGLTSSNKFNNAVFIRFREDK